MAGSAFLEKLADKRDIKSALAYGAVCWRAFAVSGDKRLLSTARSKAYAAFSENPSSPELCLLSIFLEMTGGDLEYAGDLLNQIKPYKNYYKNNNTAVFCGLQYLWALYDMKTEKPRGAKKSLRALEEASFGDTGGLADMCVAGLCLYEGKLAEAGKWLFRSFQKRCRSPFLFVTLYEFFRRKDALTDPRFLSLLVPFLSWAANSRPGWGEVFSDIVEGVMDFYESDLSLKYVENNQLPVFERLFDVFDKPWILAGICHTLIENDKTSAAALSYYRKAAHRQINLPGLTNALVRAAYRHQDINLNRFTIGEFLHGHDGTGGLGLQGFLYRVLLSDQKFEALVAEYADEIENFAYYCLENNVADTVSDRCLCGVFMFVLLKKEGDPGLLAEYRQAMERLVYERLFTADLSVQNPAATHVWITEKEKKHNLFVELENGRRTLAADPNRAVCICFSKPLMRFVESDVQLRRHAENAGPGIFAYFYRQGAKGADLLIALSRYMMALETPPPEAADILSDTLKLSDISNSFRTQLSAALGNMLYAQNRRDKALAYYDGVDENYLNDRYIEQMLLVFVSTGELEKAARLVTKKGHCISDRTLFHALKQLGAHKRFRPFIADAAYELILKSWYDKSLLSIVLNHYKGSQQDWQALSRVLSNISASEESLDEIILKNCVWTHSLDSGAQRVFCRMVGNSPDNACIGLFAQYLSYEIIINGAKPDYDTVVILENMFLESGESLLAYALSNVYLEHKLTTLHSDEILEKTLVIMEKEGILWPVFKTSKDKKLQVPYIVKKLPFIYRSQPGKNVTVHVKTDDAEGYTPCPMKYFRFGLYTAQVTHFFGEKMTYYFTEEMRSGSIVSRETTVVNNTVYLSAQKASGEEKDPYFAINDAYVYEQMFKYEQVETILADVLQENHPVRGKIL